jgi:hypothetical protein
LKRENYFPQLLNIRTDQEFSEFALRVFRYQYESNKIYNLFCNSIHRDPSTVNNLESIPFLPVEFFKTHEVISGTNSAQTKFTSSGTTGTDASKHFVPDVKLYEDVFTNIFEKFYGPVTGYTFLALLPSYLEREGSSLVYMADKLIQLSGSADSGFYLNEFDMLSAVLNRMKQQNKKTILLGVTYALLDFVSDHQIDFPQLIVMETGGMKGRRREMLREEVHERLCTGFGVSSVHSEYGMTELLSQAYSKGKGIFESPSWMKIIIRDPYDPFVQIKSGSGGINIIDLANIDSCCFIATQDVGKITGENKFEILGRFDFSELRGCNLMVE